MRSLGFILLLLTIQISAEAVPVTVIKAKRANLQASTLVQGEIESRNYPHIAAKVAGELISVKVDEGMRVKKGQLLARIDSEPFEIALEKAQASIQRLKALIENQRRTLQRRQKLVKKKLMARNQLDQAETDLKLSGADLLSAKAQLRNARYQLSQTKITSPINGVIQQRLISKGDYANPGKVLFQIVETDNLRARLYLPETLAASIHIGQRVRLQHGKESSKGKISFLRPMLEQGNRALQVLVKFKNQNHWKPGYSITARIILRTHTRTVVVPQRCLVHRPAGLVVYTIKNNLAKQTVVKTGLQQRDFIEITSGIRAGDIVALDGAAYLTDGVKVNIQESP